MKKKIISALLCVSMVATMAAGCGSTETETQAVADSTGGDAVTTTESASADNTVDAAATDEGKILNIYCWNDEF